MLRMLLGSGLHPTPHTRELAHKAEAKYYANEHRVVHTAARPGGPSRLQLCTPRQLGPP